MAGGQSDVSNGHPAHALEPLVGWWASRTCPMISPNLLVPTSLFWHQTPASLSLDQNISRNPETPLSYFHGLGTSGGFSICFVICGHNLVIGFTQRIHLVERNTFWRRAQEGWNTAQMHHGYRKGCVGPVQSAQCLNLIDQAQVTHGPALNLILFNQLSLINSLPLRSMIKVM